jgi:hypothetical protein
MGTHHAVVPRGEFRDQSHLRVNNPSLAYRAHLKPEGCFVVKDTEDTVPDRDYRCT